MDLGVLFDDAMIIIGVVCLGLLAVGWIGLSRGKGLTGDSRIIFIVMFVLVLLFLVISIVK